MKTSPIILAVAFSIMACSAESAPDNAAGSIKQAPVSKKEEAVHDLINGPDAEGDGKDGKDGKGGKEPKETDGPPKCSDVTEEICPDPSRQDQKVCLAPMKQQKMYDAGCKPAPETTPPKEPEFGGKDI